MTLRGQQTGTCSCSSQSHPWPDPAHVAIMPLPVAVVSPQSQESASSGALSDGIVPPSQQQQQRRPQPLMQLRMARRRVGNFVRSRVDSARNNLEKFVAQQQQQQQRSKDEQTPHQRQLLCLASLSATAPVVPSIRSSNSSEAQCQSNGVATVACASASEEMSGTSKALRFMLAGGIAGAVVETSLYPIDTIKTRLQAARAGQGFKWGGLYKGLPGNIVGVFPYVPKLQVHVCMLSAFMFHPGVPGSVYIHLLVTRVNRATAIFFGVYEPVKRALLARNPEDTRMAQSVAGATAALVSSTIRVPTEVIKQRMQTGQFNTAIQAVQQVVSKEGVKGLYAVRSLQEKHVKCTSFTKDFP